MRRSLGFRSLCWMVALPLVLAGCSPEVRDFEGSTSGSSSTTGGSGGGTGAGGGTGTGGAGGGVPASDPFASGNAVVTFDHDLALTFDETQIADPNIWDLTYYNGQLYAIVVSASVDGVAEVKSDGAISVLFVTPVPVAAVLANDDTHFVLDTEGEVYSMSPQGAVDAMYAGPVTGGLRASAGIGNIIYELGVGVTGSFGVHFINLDDGKTGEAFAISGGLPDFLASSQGALITGEVGMGTGCLLLRAYLPDGSFTQELCIAHPFAEVNGMALHGSTLAISDRTAGKVYFFTVAEEP